MRIIFLICICLFLGGIAIQADNSKRGIWDVYWYNIPSIDSVCLAGNFTNIHSSLMICLDTLYFDLNICVLDSLGNIVFEKRIKQNMQSNTYNLVKVNQVTFRLEIEAPYLSHLPQKIIVRDNINNINRIFECEYCVLSGCVTSTNGKCENGYIGIIPDDFQNVNMGIRTDSAGRYRCFLPKRSYNAIFAIDKYYGKNTLETWYWSLKHEKDFMLDFIIQNGEVYNLHVWKNNGGGNSLFISFRPMVINKKNRHTHIHINNERFALIDNSVVLSKKNVRIYIDNVLKNIKSLQCYYETGYCDNALLAYIIQIEIDNNRYKELRLNFDKIIKNKSYHGNACIGLNYE